MTFSRYPIYFFRLSKFFYVADVLPNNDPIENAKIKVKTVVQA